ncbi:MAG: hypothetical protein JRF20_07815 [Deltaproteobacteria bacterium]|nr:hypothetical protein [Deltaproteobacteria bacterium]MBW2081283.1 hypothetical protein [Deltaproteobacteria bacterium]MBW2351081.1 hypothetical protein [Deltaproteobacteria bacterium]
MVLENDNEKGVRKIFQHFPLMETEINKEVAIHSRYVVLTHQDLADRFLAATAHGLRSYPGYC